MALVKIFKYSLILILLQIASGTVIALYASSEPALSLGSPEYFALNYTSSFVISVTLLALLGLGLKANILVHLAVVSAIVFLTGNLISFALLRELLPLTLYLIDLAFSVSAVITAWLISWAIINKRASQHGN
ncbi:hypothetical protein DXV75_16905 [Alteromonas aestuariivivens]|uniref:Uncharacterized protein n=1 Tax=Alteromonas aestuariivivens TaxID=1938339 RepID=A0A3D8M420_9ALTE|nr:hypothetical protein [Alteromonas aestuariivivens]RDV23882.1 hypothetical protein DXV75_16905 [Alteromonas aestuariivivens]